MDAGFIADLELVGCDPHTDQHGQLRSRCPKCCSTKPVLLIDPKDGVKICCVDGCDDFEIANALEKLKQRGKMLKPLPGRFFSEIEAGPPTQWLWKGVIPRGRFVLFEGDGELGKSSLLIDIAARISTGRPMPFDGEGQRESRGVIWIGYEDGSDTLRGRLEAAGADLSKIFDLSMVGDRPFTLPKDLEVLEDTIARVGADFCVFDPILATLGIETDSGNDPSVRRAMTPLVKCLERTACAGGGIRHWSKDASRKAAHRGGGSTAFANLSRGVWCFLRDPDDQESLLMARVKANLVKNPSGVRFRLEDHDGHPTIFYLGAESRHADEILGRKQSDKNKAAIEWLREILKDGAMSSNDILEKGGEAGFSRVVIFAAKKEAGIPAKKDGMNGGWTWALPEGKAG